MCDARSLQRFRLGNLHRNRLTTLAQEFENIAKVEVPVADTSKCFRFSLTLLAVLVTLIMVPAHAQTYSVVYNFGSSSEYAGGGSVVTQGRDGNMYGTGYGAINNSGGVVFKITPQGIFTVIYSFDGTHGYGPQGGLTLGTDGNFYGTTKWGGSSGSGTVFRITPSGTLTVLYNFTGGTDGGEPVAPPIQGDDGSLYGMTNGDNLDYGKVYRLAPSGKFTTLYQFTGPTGIGPESRLIQGKDRHLYGTAARGGVRNYGTAFTITPSGAFSVLNYFDATHGSSPVAPVIESSDGNLYGTTLHGGSGKGGTVYRLTTTGEITVLANFASGTPTANPYAGLVQATDGYFYGATRGVTYGTNGTLFRISAEGAISTLYTFNEARTGRGPADTLVQHTNGLLYSDTQWGGTGSICPCGVFYSLNEGLMPFVSLVRTSGKVGSTVEVLGQGFAGTTSVSIGGISARFNISSDTYLTATVPSGAATIGYVTVTGTAGTLTSNKEFHITP
jgi:uncharacterized repeat protein (TIGR03803 family)